MQLIDDEIRETLEDRADAYDPPEVDALDPSFIFLSPTLLQREDFEAQGDYQDPPEPKVIQSFDWAAQKQATVEAAEEFVDAIRSRLDRADDMYDKVFEIMSSKRYRAGTKKKTRFDDNRDLFRPTVTAHIDAGTPIEFVLPSFPYKFANPVKVARKRPDMAEVLCLSQLYEICCSIGLVYEPGVRFIIISDGSLYQSIFGITQHEADTFRELCVEMIHQLGYDDHLEMVDMEHDLIEPVRSAFDAVRDRMRPVLAEWWEKNPESERRASLISSSSPNINTDGQVSHDLVKMATKNIMSDDDEEEVLDQFEQVRTNVRERAEKAAFEFALVLYTLKELDLVATAYPEAIRATVHPKPGQWGLHLVNEHTQVFPWQGVAYKAASGRWTVKYEFDVLRRRAVPVHLEGDMFPFYYEEAAEQGG